MRTLSRAAVGVLALAVLASQAGAVQLRHKFKAGDAHSYKVSLKGRGESAAAGMPEPMRMEMAGAMVTTQKVLSTSPDGKSAQVEQAIKSGTMTMTIADKPTTIEVPQERMVLSMTDRGQVLSVKTTTAAGKEVLPSPGQGSEWMQLTAAMAFPEKDVSVNEVWEATGSVKMGEGITMQVKARSRLLKLLTYKGRPCAQIRTAFEIPLEPLVPQIAGEQSAAAPQVQGTLSGQIVWYFDHVNGLVVDESGTVKMLMKMTFTMGEQSLESSSTMVMNVTSVLQQ